MKIKTVFFALLMMSIIANAQVQKDTIVVKPKLEVKDSMVVKMTQLITPSIFKKWGYNCYCSTSGNFNKQKRHYR